MLNGNILPALAVEQQGMHGLKVMRNETEGRGPDPYLIFHRMSTT